VRHLDQSLIREMTKLWVSYRIRIVSSIRDSCIFIDKKQNICESIWYHCESIHYLMVRWLRKRFKAVQSVLIMFLFFGTSFEDVSNMHIS